MRNDSACASSRLLNWIASSFVTPSTSSATSAAEARRELVLRRRGVLDDVVQDRRDQRVGIEMQIREDRGGRHRVRDEGLAGEAFLSLVGGGAELGRLLDALHLLRRQIFADCGQKLLESRGCAFRRGAVPGAKTHSP